jgi:hypothetical protein
MEPGIFGVIVHRFTKDFFGSGPAITAHNSLDIKQEIQIQIQILPAM